MAAIWTEEEIQSTLEYVGQLKPIAQATANQIEHEALRQMMMLQQQIGRPDIPPPPEMSASVESELAAINKRLAEIDAMLAGLAAKLAEATAALAAPKPPPKAKSPLTMRAYRGMQCGFNDD